MLNKPLRNKSNRLLFSFKLVIFSITLAPNLSLACDSNGPCKNLNCPTSLQGSIQDLVSAPATMSYRESITHWAQWLARQSIQFLSHPLRTSSHAVIYTQRLGQRLTDELKGFQRPQEPRFPAPVAGIIFDYLEGQEIRKLSEDFKEFWDEEKGYHLAAKDSYDRQSRTIDLQPSKTPHPSLYDDYTQRYFLTNYLKIHSLTGEEALHCRKNSCACQSLCHRWPQDRNWKPRVLTPNLKTQSLSIQNFFYLCPGLNFISANFPNLTRLVLSVPRHTERSWHTLWWWSSFCALDPDACFRNELKDVYFDLHDYLKIYKKGQFASILTRLEHLTLQNIHLHDAPLLVILNALPPLKSLDLSGNLSFIGTYDPSLFPMRSFILSRESETLESLNLRQTSLMDFEGITSLSHLKFLDISFLHSHPMNLSKLRKLSKLTSLNLSGHLLDLTEERLSFIESLSLLESLTLQSMDLTDTDLDPLEKLTHLKELDLSTNQKITLIRLKQLLQTLPELTILRDYEKLNSSSFQEIAP